jgi:hypothetical protein
MNNAKHCSECERIVTEMRSAFLKMINTKPQGDVPTRQDSINTFTVVLLQGGTGATGRAMAAK